MSATTAEAGGSVSERVFSKFPQLPGELRARIWKFALPNEDSDHMIHVEVHYQKQSTLHSCYADTNKFCGEHGKCEAYEAGKPFWAADCITNGYFSLSPDFPDMGLEGQKAQNRLRDICLVCRESLHAVYVEYPQAMRIYRGKWQQGVVARTVRCNPALDVLVILDIHCSSFDHVSSISDENTQITLNGHKGDFPQGSQLFGAFRKMLSTFRKVAFRHGEKEGEEDALETPSENEEDQQSDSGSARVIDLVSNNGRYLMLFLESIEALYIWLDPDRYPEVYMGGLTRVEDVAVFDGMFATEQKFIADTAETCLDIYRDQIKNARNHFAEMDGHWSPKPRDLERIGCYVPPIWMEFVD